MDPSIRQKGMKAFYENQLAMWNLQQGTVYLLFVNYVLHASHINSIYDNLNIYAYIFF